MRVTQGMLANNSLSYLSESYSKLDKYYKQLDSGKKISKPSEDPVIAIKGIRYRADLTKVEQYERNASEAHGWIDSADDALNQATKALQKIRELVTGAANGTNTKDELNASGQEIKQLMDHIATLGNTMYGEKYIFSGTSTDNKPIDTTSNPPQKNVGVNNDAVEIEVSNGVKLKVNADIDSIFTNDQFAALQKMVTDLTSGADTFSGDNITTVDNILNQFTTARTQLGAVDNRLTMIDDRIASQKVISKSVLSENEDAEAEEVITNLKTQEAVHRAALAVSARVIQPTLLDFLR